MEVYLIIFFRIITIMLLLLFATLLIMGKRPIGELPVFDFLVLVVMGSIVGADIAEPQIAHLPTAFAIVVLAGLQRLISFFSLRHKKVRKLITFEPTVVVYNGKLIYGNIKRAHYSVDEILMLLREKEIFDIEKVEYGIIEANGKLSLLNKPQYEAATVQHLSQPYNTSSAAATVILEGQILSRNLKAMQSSEAEILAMLRQQGIGSEKEVFFASLSQQGTLTVSGYHEHGKDLFATKRSTADKP